MASYSDLLRTNTPGDVKEWIRETQYDIEQRDEDGLTILHGAARWSGYRADDMVKVLLDEGAKIDARTEDGRTALHMAAEWSKSSPVVQALLDAGANPKAHMLDGSTPWDLIQKNDDLNRLDAYWLLASANNIERLEIIGLPEYQGLWATPLHGAAKWSNSPDVVKALLDAGANPKAKASDGSTPWDLIQKNDALKGTDVYWLLHETRYE